MRNPVCLFTEIKLVIVFIGRRIGQLFEISLTTSDDPPFSLFISSLRRHRHISQDEPVVTLVSS